MIGQIPQLNHIYPLLTAKMLLTLQNKMHPRSESHFTKDNNSLGEDSLARSTKPSDVLDLLPVERIQGEKSQSVCPSAFEPDAHDVTNAFA